jgi:hypothetical protein
VCMYVYRVVQEALDAAFSVYVCIQGGARALDALVCMYVYRVVQEALDAAFYF